MFQLGKTIKRLRTEVGFSQRDLAEAADLTPSFLSLIEKGDREPSLATIRKIADALKIPAEIIIWDAVDVPKHLSKQDQRQCELAKLIVRRFFETSDVASSR
jgi:transcriptional regulator with XRE-family HTH domain